MILTLPCEDDCIALSLAVTALTPVDPTSCEPQVSMVAQWEDEISQRIHSSAGITYIRYHTHESRKCITTDQLQSADIILTTYSVLRCGRLSEL
jgi:hypothetical protein